MQGRQKHISHNTQVSFPHTQQAGAPENPHQPTHNQHTHISELPQAQLRINTPAASMVPEAKSLLKHAGQNPAQPQVRGSGFLAPMLPTLSSCCVAELLLYSAEQPGSSLLWYASRVRGVWVTPAIKA